MSVFGIKLNGASINNKIFGVPRNIRRYFISENEASQIVIASLMNEFDGYISYPNTKYIGKQIQIKEITKRILDQINYKPRFF